MIRRVLQLSYDRTIGAFLSWIWESLTSIARRGDILQLLYVVAIIGLMAGLISAAVNPVSDQGAIIYPNDSGQTYAEVVINSFVVLLGGAGIYLTYMSGRQTTRARAVNMYLGLAILLLVVSLLTGVDVANIKGL